MMARQARPLSTCALTLALTAALAVALSPTPAQAQQAPIGQADGGRQSGGGSPLGGAAQAIPLDLPPERNGIPVPVGVVFAGGAQMLDAGVGWAVPLSFISRNRSHSRKRPPFRSGANTDPSPNTDPRFEVVTLTLLGRTVRLIPIDATYYRALLDDQTLLAWQSGTEWRVFDGTGLLYTFRIQSGLGNESIWLLTQIASGHGDASKVELVYGTEQRQAGTLTAPELYLDRVRYNFDPTGACAKHEIELAYGGAVMEPTQQPRWQGISVDNGVLRVRTERLTEIAVLAHGHGCATTQRAIARYTFSYTQDRDNRMPRLVRVDRFGAEGTPEAATAVPVVRYVYGSAVWDDYNGGPLPDPEPNPRRVGYFPRADLAWPINYESLGLVAERPFGTRTSQNTEQTLADFDGDALPDLAYRTGSSFSWARNVGGQQLAVSGGLIPDALSPPDALNKLETYDKIHRYEVTLNSVREDTWTQMIDFNGDGRTDLLQGGATWSIWLNEIGGWRVLVLPMDHVRAALDRDDLDDGLPLMRSTTAPTKRHWQCRDSNEFCSTWMPHIEVTAPQATRVEWKLLDVNGDGYPDLVADRRPSYGFEVQSNCDCDGTVECILPGYDVADPRYGCYDSFGLAYEAEDGSPTNDNDLVVFFNRAGQRLVNGISPFADAVELEHDSDCSVEMWRAVAESAGEVHTSYRVTGAIKHMGSEQRCGLLDLNGDRLIDRVTPYRVSLGTGVSFAGNFADRYPVDNLSETTTGYWDACRAVPNVPDDNLFTTTRVHGFLDVTGDGIVDYWEEDRNDEVTRLHVGTPLGLADPVEVASTTRPVISESVSDCGGTLSRTTRGLFDIDGDGRPDYLQIEAGKRQASVYTLYRGDQGWGVPAVGRITQVHNGYGARTRFRYASLKADTSTLHAVPFPEIALVESWTEPTANPGARMESTYFAYGGARMWFDAAVDRWTFRGHERMVTLRGLPSATSTEENPRVYGVATISDTWDPEDPGDAWALAGHARRTVTLAGELSRDPTALLTIDPTTDPRWHSQRDLDQAARFSDLPGYDPDADCTALGNEVPEALVSYGYYDAPCQRTGYTYPRSATSRRGTGGPFGDDQVWTRSIIEEIDSYGRATRVVHLSDGARLEDDLCEERVYATEVSGGWRVMDAPRWVRLREPARTGDSEATCAGAQKVIAGARFRYDGLIEGQVSVGRLHHETVERRDITTGVLLDEWTARTFSHGTLGSIVSTAEETGQGLGRLTQLDDYDPFYLVARRRRQTAPDAAVDFIDATELDPYLLIPTLATDTNGVGTRATVDGLGRVVQSSMIDPRDGQEYALSLVSYLGQTTVGPELPYDADREPAGDLLDPLGLRTQVRSWHVHTPLSTVSPGATQPGDGETWTTSWFDYLGRRRYGEQTLGDDYGGKRLISGLVEYDLLGQPRFVADTHEASAPAPHYGTSFTRRADGSVQCQVRGRGLQTSTTTSASEARYPSCVDELFDLQQRILIGRGPSELEVGSSLYGAYDEVRLDGMGLLQSRWRKQGTAILERMDQVQDRLGRTIRIDRHANPQTTGTAVSWTASYDSLGWQATFAEPGTAIRRMSYDRAGQPTEQWWMDGTTRRAIRHAYDGFGRQIRTREVTTVNGIETITAEDNFIYDLTSGEAFHADTDFALGQLTHAHGANQSVYFGYDPFGQTTFTAWVDDQDRRVERRTQWRLDGAPVELRFGMPDTQYVPEVARYSYDSAQRLVAVDWQDEVRTGLALYRAEVTDVFGRSRQARYGNGVVATTTYRDADRNERTAEGLDGTGWSLRAGYTYDAAMRLTRRDELSTIGTFRQDRSDFTYDGAYRLKTALTHSLVFPNVWVNDAYQYDGLGNLTSLVDHVGSRDFTAVPDTTDRDRLCRVVGASYPTGTSCSFTYDAVGNSLRSPLTPTASRRIGYDHRGHMSYMEQVVGATPTGPRADWRYGPLGDVAKLNLVSSSTGDNRSTYRFGAAAQRHTIPNGTKVPTVRWDRDIPGPGGVLVTKRGSGSSAKFLYRHDDAGGARAFTDAQGAVVQYVEYRPFGEVRTSTAAPGSTDYTSHLWNGGDLLQDFKVTVLGPRAHDARLGRFLQRDPIVAPRSASRANPYAFAWNDPVNHADPTGLDTETDGGGFGGGLVGVGLGLLASWLTELAWEQDAIEQAEHLEGLLETLPANAGWDLVCSQAYCVTGETRQDQKIEEINGNLYQRASDGYWRKLKSKGAWEKISQREWFAQSWYGNRFSDESFDAVGSSAGGAVAGFGLGAAIGGGAALLGAAMGGGGGAAELGPLSLEEADILVGGGVTTMGGGYLARYGSSAGSPQFQIQRTSYMPRTRADATVSSRAPAPLPTNRPIGNSATQNAANQATIDTARRFGATDIRVNQQQVNAQGARVGINRPDNAFTIGGKRYYLEFDTPASARGPGHASRILANDPDGIVILITAP